MEQMKKLGPLNKQIETIPGLIQKNFNKLILIKAKKQMAKVKAIIHSMTSKERRNPSLVLVVHQEKKNSKWIRFNNTRS